MLGLHDPQRSNHFIWLTCIWSILKYRNNLVFDEQDCDKGPIIYKLIFYGLFMN